jgi:hypothetical protein
MTDAERADQRNAEKEIKRLAAPCEGAARTAISARDVALLLAAQMR